MNVVAGILIGWFNDLWLARIFIPVAWGLTWCAYKSIVDADREYEEKMIAAGREPPTGSTYRRAFYKIEFLTATTTAFVFSILAGVAKVLWG